VKPTVSVDTRQWVTAARQLKETSSRTCVDFINGQALKVTSLAIKLTGRADARKIERELGAVGRSVSFKKMTRGKNKGKTRTVRGDYTLGGEDTLAHRILIARRIKTGKFGVHGQLLADKARNLIRARVASINFVRAGWIPALKQLWMAVRTKPRVSSTSDGAKQRGQSKGGARKSVFSLRSIIQAEIWNSALNKVAVPPETKGNPMKTAQEGLRKALAESAKDMMAELARRLNPELRKVSAK
jgi:hypothetical protein